MQRPELIAADPGAVSTSHQLVRTTLGEMAGTLPHGFLKPDGSPTTYAFKRANMGLRRKLGALRTRKDLKHNPGRHTTHWLATALAELDGEPLPGKLAAAALKVGRLTMGDILFLLFAWQHQASKKGMPMAAHGCGVCGEAFDSIRVDLGTMEVHRLPRLGDVHPEGHEQEGQPIDLATPLNPPRARVGLHDPIPWGETEVQTVLVQPPLWVDSWAKLSDGQMRNSDLVKATLIRAEIAQMLGCPMPTPTPAMIDELMDDDVTLIDEAASQITPTPDLRVEVTCPSDQCQATNTMILDWQSPAFFGASS